MKKYRFHLLVLLLSPLLSTAQLHDSLQHSYPLRFTNRQLVTPISLSIFGLLASSNSTESLKNEIVEERNENLANFHTKIDNYLQFSPIVIAYGLDALGYKSKTDILNRSIILLKGELMVNGVVQLMKTSTHVLRPDGSSYNSFPSGHTAQAFAAATFLNEEYGQRFKWVPYASYGIASSVGLLRMANNKHYLSDVLVGAGLGILSMKVAYWTHRYKWGNNKNVIAHKALY